MKNYLIPLENRKPSVATRAAGFVAALLMVALATLSGLLIPQAWGNAPVVLLYLPPVLLTAVYSGLWPALVAAVVSTLAFNYYFTAPYRTFVIHSAADIVTVVILFLVALVTSQLAASLRKQARLAASHAARNATIAGFARKLLSCTSEVEIAETTTAQLASLFDCHSVLTVEREGIALLAASPQHVVLAPSDLAAAALALETGEVAGRGVQRAGLADWQFNPVTSNEKPIAVLGLAREDGQAPIAEGHALLLTSLLDQVALALERARLNREAREAATMHERDGIRSALLASIGEDIKPRLNMISTSVRALKRDGSNDKALLSTVASEAAKLDRYVDNLVVLSPGAEQKPIVIGSISVDLHRRTVCKNGEDIHLTPKEYALLAELAKHVGRVLTHAQLLNTVWGPAHADHIDYLRVAIRSLRQKLEGNPADPEYILNEPAVGYRLVAH